jgi:hypothetical protein
MLLAGQAQAAQVAYFDFEEGAGATTTDQISATVGAISGATWTTGQYGGGLHFNGTDFVSAFNANYLVTQGTIMAWLNHDDVAALGGFGAGVPGDANGWNAPWTGLQVGQNTIGRAFAFSNNGTLAGNHINTGEALPSTANGTWHHYAATNDGTNLTLYLDGVQIAQIASGAAITYQNNPSLIMGHRHNIATSAEGWTGIVDEVKLFNTALDAAAIQAAMAPIPEPATLGLMGLGALAILRRKH